MKMSSPVSFAVLTLLVLCLCAVSGKNVDSPRTKRTTDGVGNSCQEVKSFFEMSNITLITDDTAKGRVCGGQCCGNRTEAQLRKQAQRSLAELLQHSSRSLQGILSSTGATLQSHVSEIAYQSEEKTLSLFSQVYRSMSVLSRDPIVSLYTDIRRYVQVNSTQDGEFSAPPLDIRNSVTRFFTDIFPLVYHHILDSATKDFTTDYKLCLKKSINDVKPYAEIPRQTAQTLSKSLEATVLLLKSLMTGTHVLNATDRLFVDDNFKHNSECHDAVLKMTFCPKCLGMARNVKPCSGYCLNVLRGCLTRYVVELDAPWNGYVEDIGRLVNAIKNTNNDFGVNMNYVMIRLTDRITDAIMYAMENVKVIDNRVKRSCGVAQYTSKEDSRSIETTTSTITTGSGKPRQNNGRAYPSLPESQLSQLLGSLSKSKGFYGNLADTLCHDESWTESKDRHCWNGERIADYTKVITDISLDNQKYNPEIKVNLSLQSGDPRVADLADKLRQVHQLVITSLGQSSDPDIDYMQRDGVDGSGSGSGPYEDEDEDMRGSGSGDSNPDEGRTQHEGISVTSVDTQPDQARTTPTSTAHLPIPSPVTTCIVFAVFAMTRRNYY